MTTICTPFWARHNQTKEEDPCREESSLYVFDHDPGGALYGYLNSQDPALARSVVSGGEITADGYLVNYPGEMLVANHVNYDGNDGYDFGITVALHSYDPNVANSNVEWNYFRVRLTRQSDGFVTSWTGQVRSPNFVTDSNNGAYTVDNFDGGALGTAAQASMSSSFYFNGSNGYMDVGDVGLIEVEPVYRLLDPNEGPTTYPRSEGVQYVVYMYAQWPA